MIHAFDTEDAKKYGLVEAVVLNNFRFWIGQNKANGKHFYDDHTWTYNSVKAFGALFPYLTLNQVRRCVESLVDQGVLLRANYNESAYDKTSWYAFSDEQMCHVHVADLPNGGGGNAQSEADSKHRLKTQIAEEKAQAPDPAPTKPVDQPAKPAASKKPASYNETYPLPDWIDRDHWNVWRDQTAHRKATDAQKRLVVAKLEKWRADGIDAALALENSATNGWQGLFPPDHNTPANRAPAYQNRQDKNAAWLAAMTTPQPTPGAPDDRTYPHHADDNIFDAESRFLD